jgi:hypothetical protein
MSLAAVIMAMMVPGPPVSAQEDAEKLRREVMRCPSGLPVGFSA